MIRDYEINMSTLAIIPLDSESCKVIEEDEEFYVAKSANTVVDYSCRFFGSSYVGRFEGTKSLIGINYKSPIVIEESREIIFFPTSSPRFENCTWVSLANINRFRKSNRNSIVVFKNGYELELDLSYASLENQILRSALLESMLRNRKKVNL